MLNIRKKGACHFLPVATKVNKDSMKKMFIFSVYMINRYHLIVTNIYLTLNHRSNPKTKKTLQKTTGT